MDSKENREEILRYLDYIQENIIKYSDLYELNIKEYIEELNKALKIYQKIIIWKDGHWDIDIYRASKEERKIIKELENE